MIKKSSNSIGQLNPENSILFVCDVQKKFKDLIYMFDSLVNQILCMIKACKELNIPIIFTEQYPLRLEKTIDELKNESPDSMVFEKTTYSMCTPELLTHISNDSPLKQRKSVILVGIAAHVCVLQSALDFKDQGYDVHVIADAVSADNNYDRVFALSRMKQSGVFITTLEGILFQLSKDSKHPSFKNAISSITKNRKDFILSNPLTLSKL